MSGDAVSSALLYFLKKLVSNRRGIRISAIVVDEGIWGFHRLEGARQIVVSINVGPNVTSYNDSGLARKTKYFYRVLAFNLNFSSPWTPTVNVTTKK